MYEVVGPQGNRMLIVPHNSTHRWSFKEELDGEKWDVKLKQVGNKCVAPILGKLIVYSKPKANEFHREYMRENGLALYRGLPGCDHDRLVENMLEYVEEL